MLLSWACGNGSQEDKPDISLPLSSQHEVTVSLEEVMSGTRKHVEYTRQVAREDGGVDCIPATIDLDIPPGVPEGAHFKAPGMVQAQIPLTCHHASFTNTFTKWLTCVVKQTAFSFCYVVAVLVH
jgi:hypothetical protein